MVSSEQPKINSIVRILSSLLYRLYPPRRPILRAIVLRVIGKLEGGEMLSGTFRRIFLDYHGIEIGMYSYGGCFDPLRIRPFVKIGRYCSFADGVCIFNANHPFTWKSTHPYFYTPVFGHVAENTVERARTRVEIGNDVWIGQNAIILARVNRIGDGAVIGAGSVVTKNVPDFAVVAGNPAKIIKYRFSQATICKLKKERWWDKDIEELKANIDEFCHPVEMTEGACHNRDCDLEQ